MGKYNLIYIPYSISVLLVNLVFIGLYIFDKQFTHKFKINTQKWPWEESAEKWKKLLLNILYVYVNILNNILIVSS
jgi:hypothetical protein